MTDSRRTRVYDKDSLNIGACTAVNADQLITPAEQFFKRSHASVPTLDPASWRLEVQGLVAGPTVYSLPDLTTRFQRRDITATLVCAGLRRAEFLAMGPLPGELPWGPDAASTGCWSGISLAEVLRAVGVRDQACHVEFVGSDSIERQGHQFGFGGSIDMRKALADEVILATHLNGSPLPPSHGFPLRAIVPGWIGARSVKWLNRITALATPSENYFQAKAYRIQREVNPADPLDVTSGVPMAEVPLNTVILEPKADAVVPAGRVRVRGWAIGSACRPTTAIQVSAGGASDWVNAEILAAGGKWTWTFWEAVVRVPPGCHLLSARASDETGTMPARVHDTWNVKGYANNAWYRVAITAR